MGGAFTPSVSPTGTTRFRPRCPRVLARRDGQLHHTSLDAVVALPGNAQVHGQVGQRRRVRRYPEHRVRALRDGGRERANADGGMFVWPPSATSRPTRWRGSMPCSPATSSGARASWPSSTCSRSPGAASAKWARLSGAGPRAAHPPSRFQVRAAHGVALQRRRRRGRFRPPLQPGLPLPVPTRPPTPRRQHLHPVPADPQRGGLATSRPAPRLRFARSADSIGADILAKAVEA